MIIFLCALFGSSILVIALGANTRQRLLTAKKNIKNIRNVKKIEPNYKDILSW